jgi:hypothetical protein
MSGLGTGPRVTVAMSVRNGERFVAEATRARSGGRAPALGSSRTSARPRMVDRFRALYGELAGASA